jgi:hypothetical protein
MIKRSDSTLFINTAFSVVSYPREPDYCTKAPKHAKCGPQVVRIVAPPDVIFELLGCLPNRPELESRDQEAGIHFCMVVISQVVWTLVWTNPGNGLEIKTPSRRASDIMDVSYKASTKATMSGLLLVFCMRGLVCSSRNVCCS